MRMFLIFLTILFYSCSTYKREGLIEFKLLNNHVIDDEKLTIEVNNNTQKNYYLPFDYRYFNRIDILPNYIYNGILPSIVLMDNQEVEAKVLHTPDSNMYHHFIVDSVNAKYRKLEELNKKPKQMPYQDFLLLKANSKAIINLKFNIKRKGSLVANYFIEYILEPNKNYTVSLEYQTHDTIIKKHFRKETLDSLHKNGYKLYTGKIVSNKVPLIKN